MNSRFTARPASTSNQGAISDHRQVVALRLDHVHAGDLEQLCPCAVSGSSMPQR
jgi:hypothetical protein